MARISKTVQVFYCDQCRKEASTFLPDLRFLPDGWLRLSWGAQQYRGNQHERHFCKVFCLESWLTLNKPHFQPDPRFEIRHE